MPLKSYKICSKIFEHRFEQCSKKLQIWGTMPPLRDDTRYAKVFVMDQNIVFALSQFNKRWYDDMT